VMVPAFVAVVGLDQREAVATSLAVIVVTALVENAGHGSEVAAPLTAQIIDFYLTNYSNVLTETE